jgi:hypothetical protein
MGRKRAGIPRRGKAIITRISITGLDTWFVVDEGRKLTGWKSSFRELLRRESEHLRSIAMRNMELKSETDQNTKELDGMVSESAHVITHDFKMEECDNDELLWMTMESQWSTDVLDPGEYEYED